MWLVISAGYWLKAVSKDGLRCWVSRYWLHIVVCAIPLFQSQAFFSFGLCTLTKQLQKKSFEKVSASFNQKRFGQGWPGSSWPSGDCHSPRGEVPRRLCRDEGGQEAEKTTGAGSHKEEEEENPWKWLTSTTAAGVMSLRTKQKCIMLNIWTYMWVTWWQRTILGWLRVILV